MDVTPGTIDAQGQATGAGCVYPSSVQTIADQLDAKGLTWRGYMEDMGNTPSREAATCAHPALNSPDGTQTATANDQYATRHDPFVYFHSIIDSPGCAAKVLPFTQLADDLRSELTTPNYSFITPNLCHDGHDTPCKDNEPGGLQSAGQFLSSLVPQIVSSPAFQKDGLLIVTFDEAASDSSSCCGEQAANTPSAGGSSPGPGGGRVGAVLVSPYIQAGTVNNTAYNHYSLLRSLEDVFGLAHLGYAGAAGLQAFGSDVFNLATPVPPTATSTSTPTPTLTQTSSAPAACRARAVPKARHRRLRRGALIQSLSLATTARRAVLRVRVTHAAHLVVSIATGGRTRRLAARTVQPCRTYSLTLPTRHGTVRVSASVHGGVEGRTLRA